MVPCIQCLIPCWPARLPTGFQPGRHLFWRDAESGGGELARAIAMIPEPTQRPRLVRSSLGRNAPQITLGMTVPLEFLGQVDQWCGAASDRERRWRPKAQAGEIRLGARRCPAVRRFRRGAGAWRQIPKVNSMSHESSPPAEGGITREICVAPLDDDSRC